MANVNAFGGGKVTVVIFENSLWDEFSAEVDVSVQGDIFATVSGKVDYFKGSGCGSTGIQNACASVSPLKGKLTASFQIGPFDESFESDEVVFLDGTAPCL